MKTNKNNLFADANHKLHVFLERADGLVHGTTDVSAEDLRALGRLLETMAPQMAEVSHNDSDAVLQEQVQRYIANLRSLQVSLEQIRCVMLARRAKLDSARLHVEGVRSWANAYRQTA
jgi:hypothetical protein